MTVVELRPRRVQDWISGFLEYTSMLNSPEIFRLWAGISAVAGVLERRVFTTFGGKILFPSLYVMLVAPPGVGKTEAIRATSELWHGIRELKVAPDSMTRASFVDELFKAKQIRNLSGELLEYSALNIAADELGTLISGHDLDFLSVFNSIYDQRSIHHEVRRTGGQDKQITNPIVNMVVGTQPAFLASLLPEEAWGMGWMSRQILVYCGTVATIELFPDITQEEHELLQPLRDDLEAMSRLVGEVGWEQQAKNEMRRWYTTGMHPKPTHSKLGHYSVRRHVHLAKLSAIAAISHGSFTIRMEDLSRARDWLLGAEQTMPDIFREMVGKSDTQVLQELHLFAFQAWSQNGKAPIHESLLFHFLQARVPSEKIKGLMEIADRARIIQRVAGTADMWIPKPKNMHGVE